MDADHFAGLDPAVVGEVLDNPAVRQSIIEEESDAAKESRAQGVVINFMTCRDALRVYQGWVNTGVAPSLEPLPIPTNPREPSFSAITADYAMYEAAIASGELEQLRFQLTAEGSCGWIPANPGDPGGPTVRDVIEAGS